MTVGFPPQGKQRHSGEGGERFSIVLPREPDLRAQGGSPGGSPSRVIVFSLKIAQPSPIIAALNQCRRPSHGKAVLPSPPTTSE